MVSGKENSCTFRSRRCTRIYDSEAIACNCGGSIWIRKLEIVNSESSFKNTGKRVLIGWLAVWKKVNEDDMKVTREWILFHFSKILFLILKVICTDNWRFADTSARDIVLYFSEVINIKKILRSYYWLINSKTWQFSPFQQLWEIFQEQLSWF